MAAPLEGVPPNMKRLKRQQRQPRSPQAQGARSFPDVQRRPGAPASSAAVSGPGPAGRPSWAGVSWDGAASPQDGSLGTLCLGGTFQNVWFLSL